MKVLEKVDWKMFSSPRFWRWVPVGMTVGVWCFVSGMALHSCVAETAPAAKEPTKTEAMERQADLDAVKLERAYERMDEAERMKGVVYE
jgi:hypothetical protein